MCIGGNQMETNLNVRTNTSVLFISTETKSISTVIKYLEEQRIEVTVMSDLSNIVAVLKQSKFNAIFISWNLPGVSVPKLYSLLANDLKYLCVVYSENGPKMSTLRMINTRIPNLIFPPLSPTNVHKRLESLLRKQASNESAFQLRKQPVNIPAPRVGQIGTYLESSDRHGSLDLSDYRKSPEVGSVSNQNSEQNANIRVSINDNLLISSIKRIATYPNHLKNLAGTSNKEIVTYGVLINSSNIKGYLLLNKIKGENDSRAIKNFLSDVKILLENKGEKIERIDELFKLEMDSQMIESIKKIRSVKSCSINTGSGSLICMFVEQTVLPTFLQSPVQDMIQVDIRNCIVEDTKLKFDLYLYLALNKRCLHYFRAGSSVSQDTARKLKDFNVGTLIVPALQKPEFLAYCVETALAAFVG
jgi:DNA-binding response OmpR family regulator